MTNVQERFPTATLAAGRTALPEISNRAGFPTPLPVMRGDGIRRDGPQLRYPLNPDWAQSAGAGFGISGIISQLMNIIQQLLSLFGMSGASGAQTYFQNATGSSSGDPHLRFTGMTGAGAQQQCAFDSMTGHPDLLESDSFAGGFQISTAVTQPASNGVTFNERATISTDFGHTAVSLDNEGNASITQNGQSVPLQDGASYDVGNGETVFRNADGSVGVRDDNGLGGTITTILRQNGQGVDVDTQAANVDLSGDLVNQPPQTPRHSMRAR